MKDKIKQAVIYTLVILLLLLIGFIVFDVNTEFEQEVEYSTYSTKEKGFKVVYLLAEKMGFEVSRYKRPSRFLPDDATMVVYAPDETKFNDPIEQKYLLKWLQAGNSMILIDSSLNYSDKFNLEELSGGSHEQFGDYGDNYIFNVGSGRIIFLEEYESFSNDGIEILEPGVIFINALNATSNKKVLFNEFYHGIGSDSANVWDILSSGGRLIVIQVFLALLIYLYIKSRRFGKPLVVFEIVKRKENENLFALSNLYIKSKSNNIALSIYLENLKKELSKFLGLGEGNIDENEIILVSNTNNVLKDMSIEEVLKESRDYINITSRDSKKLLYLFQKMEKIRKEIKA